MIPRKVKLVTILSLLAQSFALATPLGDEHRKGLLFPRATDPGTVGPYQATTPADYVLPNVTIPSFATPVEMQAVVVGPQGVSGSRPLVVLLHGQHQMCYLPNPNDPDDHQQGLDGDNWPCVGGRVPFPSYRGYLQTQRLLATQGFVSVSISCNGVNAQANDAGNSPIFRGMFARSMLVRLHLARWTDWSGSGRSQAPAVIRDVPPADMSSVMLFGHSRGGEGVNRAAIDSLTPPPGDHPSLAGVPASWRIRGQFLIGPKAYGQNPAPDVPSAVILPGCDGDVDNLEGQMYIDATRGVSRGFALHSAIFVENANHNWFNAEWKNEDGTIHNPTCTAGSPDRLSSDTQRAVGATYAAAAAKLFLTGDDSNRPFLDGSPVSPPPSVSPARIHTHALGGNRSLLLIPDNSTAVSGNGVRICQQVAASGSTAGCDISPSPHTVQFQTVRPEVGRYLAHLEWSSPGAARTLRTGTPRNIAGSESIALRIIVPDLSTGTRLQLAIIDSAGRRAVLPGEIALSGLPNTAPIGGPYWGQEARVSLSGATSTGLNLAQVTALELTPLSSSGRAWIVDAWGWRSGAPDPQISSLPRADLGELVVPSGSGSATVQLSVPVSGSGNGRVRVFVVDPVSSSVSDRLITIQSGTTSFNVPVTVAKDVPAGTNRTYLVAAKAVQGMMLGDPVGAVIVQGT